MANNVQQASEFDIANSFAHMLHRIGQIANDYHLKEFGRNGLSARQFAVLSALATKPDCSQTDLVSTTNIDRSTMAEIIKRLLDKKLIERVRSSSDARANILRLSEAGQAEYMAALPKVMAIDKALLSRMNEKNQARAFDILSALLSGADNIPNQIEKSAKKAKKSKKSKKKKEG